MAVSNNQKAYFFTGLVILFWSTSATAFKIALKHQSIPQLLLLSTFFSLLIFFISIICQKKTKMLLTISSKALNKSILLGFLNPFLYYTILFHAYQLLPAQQAQPLNMTWGIVIAIISIPILKQKLKLKDLTAIFITYFGVIIIIIEGDFSNFRFNNTTGVILALFSAFIWSIYWLLNAKDKQLAIVRLFYNFLFGLIWIGIYHFIFYKITIPSPAAILSSLYVGIFEYGFTYILWLLALKLIDRTIKISILIYIVPFISFLFISIFLKEKILASSIIGAFFIITGIFYHKFGKIKLTRKS